MRGLSLGTGMVRRAAPALALPSFAELVGDAIFAFNETDISSLRQARDGTGSAPAVDDPVGYIPDISGNGLHAVAPSDAARPVLKADGSLYVPDFDGTDDRLAVDLSGVDRSGRFGLICLLRTSDDAAVLFGSPNSSLGRIMLGEPSGMFGAGSVFTGTDTGIPIVYRNGVVFTHYDDGEAFKNGLFTGSLFVVECTNLGISNALWDDLSIAANPSGYWLDGQLSHVAMFPDDFYTTNRAAILAHYEALQASGA